MKITKEETIDLLMDATGSMEECSNGSLQSLIKKQGGLLLPVLQAYAIQILKGMNYLHEKKIIHRDIKPGNLLLDNNFTIKIADFGLALNEDESTGGDVQGTPLYMSPELIKDGNYSVGSDVWAFGLTV
jgi:serine/threonine protein kinase